MESVPLHVIRTPPEVVDTARTISEYYCRLLRETSIHRQMVDLFDKQTHVNYVTNHQALQVLLGRTHESTVEVSAADVWKCCTVLDNNYGFSSGSVADNDWVTAVTPMRELLAHVKDQENFRADMLKISIQTAQREFPDVLGLSFTKAFSLALCGYKCRDTSSLPPEL
jgi:hypothetical protein